MLAEYRYTLTRTLDPALSKAMLWVMLNPSTANDNTDDHTIRKCKGFAERWGYGHLTVVNLFAVRATNPNDLCLYTDPVGPENDSVLEKTLASFKPADVIVAWGLHGKFNGRAGVFAKKFVNADDPFMCLGLTRSAYAQPRHPLMLSYDTPREPWRP